MSLTPGELQCLKKHYLWLFILFLCCSLIKVLFYILDVGPRFCSPPSGSLIRPRSVCWVFILSFERKITFSFYFSLPSPSILWWSLEFCTDHILNRSNDSPWVPSLSRSFLCLTAVKVSKSLMCVALLFSSPLIWFQSLFSSLCQRGVRKFFSVKC